ncbi:hypothetical protein CTEN210_11115 [Chaetoceros tenuissimus]|uniref:Roadblock/LAMTOR2 domain-containing protein n=1 Tax=Chaetoceros tenuissimus TaxID=426638 RepID=A0AAD3CZ56_9STRA|nr:hypothetical protein CTEN210_11115 [Chaetoceros tenuissimus]
MSAIEETLERIQKQPGVEAYVILNNEGEILRRMPSMSQEVAEQYANKVKDLVKKAANATRDLNPEDKLKNLRIRTKTKEMLVSFATDSVVIIIQSWSHYMG